jgi:hypothetical protein
MRDHFHFRGAFSQSVPLISAAFRTREIPRPEREGPQELFDAKPKAGRKAHQRRQMLGEGIAFIFEIEFEPLGRKYRRTACRPALRMRKAQRGAPQHEEAADTARGFAGNPEPRAIPADEERWNRVADDAGVQRSELYRGRLDLICRWDMKLLAFSRGRSRRAFRWPLVQEKRDCELYGGHCVWRSWLRRRCLSGRTCRFPL